MLFTKTLKLVKRKRALAQALAEESRELVEMTGQQQELVKQLEDRAERLLEAELKTVDEQGVEEAGDSGLTNHRWLNAKLAGRETESKGGTPPRRKPKQSRRGVLELQGQARLISRLLGVSRRVSRAARKARRLEARMARLEAKRQRLLKRYA